MGSTKTMALLLVAWLGLGGAARADAGADAKAHYKKGLSYFGLGKYSEAATEYEAAFELEPDAALLYNAAQAHRLAGHKQRALALYQSLVRLFPEQASPGVHKHIETLQAAIEVDRAKGISDDYRGPAAAETKPQPANTPASPSPAKATTTAGAAAPSGAATATAPHPGADLTTTAVAKRAPAKKSTPRWVWGVVAGAAVAVAVGVGVGLGVGLSGDSYPSPTAGSARVP